MKPILAVLTALLLGPPSALHAAEPERIGPPTYYAQDAARYMQRVPDEYHRQFYPVPVTPVTRATYMEWLEDSGLLDFVNDARRGLVGPNELLPVLAKFAQTGERRWGEACVTMLKDFHRAVREVVAKKGWNEEFVEQPAMLPLYRRILAVRATRKESRCSCFLRLRCTPEARSWGPRGQECRNAKSFLMLGDQEILKTHAHVHACDPRRRIVGPSGMQHHDRDKPRYPGARYGNGERGPRPGIRRKLPVEFYDPAVGSAVFSEAGASLSAPAVNSSPARS